MQISPETEHRVHLIFGIFALGCVGASYFYGCYPLIVLLIGMCIFGALLKAINRNNGSR